MTARRNTPERDWLDVLVTLVEAYEAKRLHQGLGIPVECLIKQAA